MEIEKRFSETKQQNEIVEQVATLTFSVEKLS